MNTIKDVGFYLGPVGLQASAGAEWRGWKHFLRCRLRSLAEPPISSPIFLEFYLALFGMGVSIQAGRGVIEYRAFATCYLFVAGAGWLRVSVVVRAKRRRRRWN